MVLVRGQAGRLLQPSRACSGHAGFRDRAQPFPLYAVPLCIVSPALNIIAALVYSSKLRQALRPSKDSTYIATPQIFACRSESTALRSKPRRARICNAKNLMRIRADLEYVDAFAMPEPMQFLKF